MLGDPCETCGNNYPARRRYINDSKAWICDQCGASEIWFPDVFWDGKPEENLADGPDGKPRVFLSRGQKAQYLRERGIYEAGDKFHGAPFTSVTREDPRVKQYRNAAAVAEARRKVESMGKDVRRQALLKVIKDSSYMSEK